MTFDAIYKANAWNGTESRSGPGSGSAATRHIGPAIIALVNELGAASVLDVACGDGYWMPPLRKYIGIDVSREAIALARERHPDRRYYVADIRYTKMALRADLVICRDAIQHLSFEEGLEVLTAIRATGSRYLLASTYVGGENTDIVTGGCYSPDLTAAPFWLGQPERLIPDGYGYEHDEVRDGRKHLGLWILQR